MGSSSLPVVSDEGDLPWSDSHSLSSDEGLGGDMVIPQSPLASEVAAWATHSTTATLQTGQLSPISPGLNVGKFHECSTPTMMHSTSSSCADSWSVEYGDGDETEAHMPWDNGVDDAFAHPKLESLEDDFNLAVLKDLPTEAEERPAAATMDQAKPKRPRGRPRKHPLTPAASANKITKGRSKTGCITCRKRKKKCDEAKPRCMNCEKNAVVCEGYHEKQIWRSGKEKAEEDRRRRESLPIITMQPIFHGVETCEDKIFWKHYCTHLSNVLTVEGEAKNAFKDIILQLATKHQGLMHSILALSSKHIDYNTPYGAKLLAGNPDLSPESLVARSDYHHDEAMKRFYEDINRAEDRHDPEYKTILSARYGQMLCLLLQTLAEGNPRGEHRVHLLAYKRLIRQSPPEDPVFLTFITEFFQYHMYADELIWHPDLHQERLASEYWVPPMPLHPPRLIGVADGLFKYLSQITTIRNTIRANVAASVDPIVDYPSLYQAAEIDAAIRDWMPQWPPGDSRDRVCLLYKQMMWVYLFRTIYPPSPTCASQSSTEPAAIRATSTPSPVTPSRQTPPALHQNRQTMSPVTAPAGSAAGSASRTSSRHEGDDSAAGSQHGPPRVHSPPPIRRPAQHDHRITVAVNESLDIVETFKASEPAQTLLLIPCLVIGASCFEPFQQERIRAAIKAIRGYTGLRNCDRVSEMLEGVWHRMSLGDWSAVWDWQGIAVDVGVDFLCT